MVAFIGELAEQVPCFSPNTKSKTVDQIFSETTRIHGVVIVHEDEPVSLITRTNFYQKIGNLYGYNLYMGRPIQLIADKEPLIVDYFESITDVSKLAMQRKEEDLYDYVIVTKENKYFGIVSIQSLLKKLVEVQVEFASFLNPLTRLPGNRIIETKLKEIVNEDKYSILYFDLDHFKAYNDTYGFKKGDELLQFTANLLNSVFDKNEFFLGHIGGDDFIAILDHHHYQAMCEKIIADFDHNVKRFYHLKHLAKKYIIAENRQGIKEKIPLVTISIAVVTNKNNTFKNTDELAEYTAIVKKHCKMEQGSCFIDGTM